MGLVESNYRKTNSDSVLQLSMHKLGYVVCYFIVVHRKDFLVLIIWFEAAMWELGSMSAIIATRACAFNIGEVREGLTTMWVELYLI